MARPPQEGQPRDMQRLFGQAGIPVEEFITTSREDIAQTTADLISRLTGRSPLGQDVDRFQSERDIKLTDEEREFALPDTQTLGLVVGAISGERKMRSDSKRKLIAKATQGTTNDLLDVTNATLLYLIGLRNNALLTSVVGIGIKLDAGPSSRDQRTIREAPSQARELLADLFKALARESKGYTIDPTRQSTSAKGALTSGLLDILPRHLSPTALNSLPQGLAEFRSVWKPLHLESLEKSRLVGVMVSPELSPREIEQLKRIDQKTPQQVTKEEFELAMKAHVNYHQAVRDPSRRVLDRLFGTTEEDGMLRVLHFLNGALTSRDPAVRNRTLRILTQWDIPPNDNIIQWLYLVQQGLEKMIDRGGENVSEVFVQELETIILVTDTYGEIMQLSACLIANYQDGLRKFQQGEVGKVHLNQKLRDKLLSAETESFALELLARAERDREANQIGREAFLELFDQRRPLGFFLDNLQQNWQDLQRITREEVWPSFIHRRQAKIWPSERELDVLQFTGRHPATVLGFAAVHFFTRGFTPPQVGLEFTFKHTDKVLRGRLDGDGKLSDLPFDLAKEIPDIHAFLEHVAVGSFEELVTIASKRVEVRGGKSDRVKAQEPKQEDDSRKETRSTTGTLLPRREITYITVSEDRETGTATTDDVIEEARVRERLPRLISQKVVPLPYAQRYRYFRNQARLAREGGSASWDEIRRLEGQAIENFTQIPNPSSDKLDSLPTEFALEQGPGGKFLDTWRKEHQRPKPKEGEELDLTTIFERRFRAAPIALTRHLETWFTQPPTS